jgi:hypothetical protein
LLFQTYPTDVRRSRMSELIHEFTMPVAEADGRAYTARVRGESDDKGHWQGWIEFVPRDGGPFLRTARETTQSSLDHLTYWASGLSVTYLEAALARARKVATEPIPAPPPLDDPVIPAEGEAGSPGNVASIEIETLDPSLPGRIMGIAPLKAGVVKRVPGAGAIVFDGEEAGEGEPGRFRFRVQFGSANSGAVNMGNRLRVDGRPVKIESHALIEALRRSV